MAVVNEAQFTQAVEPGLKKVFTNSFNEEAEMSLVGAMYNTVQSERANEDYLEIEDIGSMPEFTGDLSYTEFKQGNSKTVTPTEYALGLKIQRKFFDDDLYGIIEQIVRQMGTVARYRMEQDAAAPFVNAFNSSFTVFDGLSLCNANHTFLSTSSLQSNAGSSAFSFASLDATQTLMRKFQNSQDRFILTIKPDTVFGPLDLETTFTEVIQSDLKAGVSTNDVNVFNQKFKIMTSQFLTDTDNWFLIDSRRMKEFLIWQQRMPLEFKNTGDFDTFVKKWASYMRYANTPLHWPWIFGQAV